MTDTKPGMEAIHEALRRAKEQGRADDTEREAALRAFLDDFHNICNKHLKTIGSQMLMKAVLSYFGLVLKKSLGPLGAVLAIDLAQFFIETIIEKDIKK